MWSRKLHLRDQGVQQTHSLSSASLSQALRQTRWCALRLGFRFGCPLSSCTAWHALRLVFRFGCPLSLCTGWHQKQRRRHAMAQTRAIEPKRIRNASAIVIPNPSKLADCLCQTVRQRCLELGLGTISTSAMCQNCSCFRMGFHGLPRGFPKGFPRGFQGFPGVSSLILH